MLRVIEAAGRYSMGLPYDICLYVCMHVCMYVCMYVCIYRGEERGKQVSDVLKRTIPERESARHRDARMKDPEELQRPRRPCTRGLRAWLWFGVGGVKLKTKQVRKSPMNETFSLFAGGAIFIWVMALMGWNCFDGLGI